jgi:hypothetical protein
VHLAAGILKRNSHVLWKWGANMKKKVAAVAKPVTAEAGPATGVALISAIGRPLNDAALMAFARPADPASCVAEGLPIGSTYAQVSGHRLLMLALAGDLAAVHNGKMVLVSLYFDKSIA